MTLALAFVASFALSAIITAAQRITIRRNRHA